jgi:glycosyltransferase involved in cell wall biosynthesis
MIEAFTQVRRQVLELCDQQHFATARLFLIGSGCQVDTHTSLWEYVARRSDANGNSVVARSIRKELWEANVGSSNLALREADDALERDEFEAAEFFLEATFGSDTENHEARRRFAQSYFKQAERAAKGARVRTDRARALKLASSFSFKEPSDATVLVDLLRYSGELSLALQKNTIAQNQFGSDIRFVAREARIREQMYDLAGSAKLWEAVAERSDRLRGEALLKLCTLYERLERDDDLKNARARLVLSQVSVADWLKLALFSGQLGMAHALSEFVALGGASNTQSSDDVLISFAEELLDSGEIGLAIWLRRNRLPVGARVQRVLDAIGFSGGGTRNLPTTFADAIKIKSPNFMLPLEKTLELPKKAYGWPLVGKDPERILLVTSSFGIGGAERQFLELARSLLMNGVGKDQLHVAVFSLEQDRGHAHFLPDLQALGVPIHDLTNRKVLSASITALEHNMVEALPLHFRDDVRALLSLVKEVQPDVLHGWQDRSAAACGIAGVAASVNRIVLSARNMSPVTRRDKTLVQNEGLFRDLIGRENVMISANSQIAAADYAKWLSCPSERIDVIQNAVDMSRYPKLPEVSEVPNPSRPLCIGGVFRLVNNKRPLLWLRTIHCLRHEQKIELQPFLFGSGPLKPEVEAEAAKLGLDDLILRSGVILPTKLYNDLDVVLLMSLFEGLPNVLLEAQAMGKPVVTCDVGGAREAVKHSGQGKGLILSEQITPSDAAAKIANWLPDARRTPPYLIQRFIESQFDPKLLAQRTLESYRGHKAGRL